MGREEILEALQTWFEESKEYWERKLKELPSDNAICYLRYCSEEWAVGELELPDEQECEIRILGRSYPPVGEERERVEIEMIVVKCPTSEFDFSPSEVFA